MKIFFWETCNGDEFKINRKNQAQADFQTSRVHKIVSGLISQKQKFSQRKLK